MQPLVTPETLTEEQQSEVRKFFETGIGNAPRMFYLYGMMKNRFGMVIDKAEKMIQEGEQRKKDKYRNRMNKLIKENMEDFERKTGNNAIYQLLRLYEWEDGRTMVLGIEGIYDIENRKQKWEKVVEIEERKNPDYFLEVAKRFELKI